MDTASQIASRIAAVALNQFATEHGIAPAHLTTDLDGLTTVETLSACRALGTERVFG